MRADQGHNPVKFSSKTALTEPSYEQITALRSQLFCGANYLDPTVPVSVIMLQDRTGYELLQQKHVDQVMAGVAYDEAQEDEKVEGDTHPPNLTPDIDGDVRCPGINKPSHGDVVHPRLSTPAA